MYRWYCRDCGKRYQWSEIRAIAQSDGDRHAAECFGAKQWDVPMFVQNWRGMENALRMLRISISQGIYAFVQGIDPPSYTFGTINMYDVSLCHAIEIALKTLIALHGKNVADLKEYDHEIVRPFHDIDEGVREKMQQFWEDIPPQIEINSEQISDAFSTVEGAFIRLRYGPWTGDGVALNLEPLWLFVVTSYMVTTVFALRMIQKDDTRRIRGIAVECFEEDPSISVSVVGAPQNDDAKVGTAVVLCVIDTPMGSTVPLMIDLSLEHSIRIRQTGEFVRRA